MSENYPNYPQPTPAYGQPYPQPNPAYGQPYPQQPPVYAQPYPQAPPIFTQPYPVHNQPMILVQNQHKDVQHGCHFLICFLTSGLWIPCWIAACCGCGCERPC